jgi:hypothetical protein
MTEPSAIRPQPQAIGRPGSPAPKLEVAAAQDVTHGLEHELQVEP